MRRSIPYSSPVVRDTHLFHYCEIVDLLLQATRSPGFGGGLKGWMRVQYLRMNKSILAVGFVWLQLLHISALSRQVSIVDINFADYIQLWDQILSPMEYGVRPFLM